MRLFENLRTFVLEEEFKIVYLNNKIDVVNYTEIAHFDSTKIIINYKDGSVAVSGKGLIVSKLMHDELLIEGSIDKIEFR